MRLMNDLRDAKLSNPNQSLKLRLMHGGNHRERFFDISTTLANDLIVFHSLSHSPQRLRMDDLILMA